MIDAILAWLLKVILDWAFARAKSEALELFERLEKEKERKEINEENIKRYEEAKSRAERIKAATALLNGVKP